uniref:EF-hand domain-containing protein n=1 Tax=Ascaris lumbricoides TaxID=6252 RepID=A0A9J2PP35_ASCLU
MLHGLIVLLLTLTSICTAPSTPRQAVRSDATRIDRSLTHFDIYMHCSEHTTTGCSIRIYCHCQTLQMLHGLIVLLLTLTSICTAPSTPRQAVRSAPSNLPPPRLQPSRQTVPTKVQVQQQPAVRDPPLLPGDPGNPAAAAVIPPPVDKNVDLDGDGALSLAEVQYAAFVHHGLSSSVVEGLFNEVDKNRDGYLTSLEFNDIRPLVLAKAENAALRYMQSVDTDHNGLLSLKEAQSYILKEHGISNRDVERVWHLVIPNSDEEMDAVMFSKLRRRIRGMTIRLARQIMKTADKNEDGHIDLKEAQQIAFEQEGIGSGDVSEMLASVDDNNDGELNAPEFADFERIIRARAVDTSKKALKVVDRDGSGTLTMDEAKRIAFDHYGFDEKILGPFFAQADENEDGQLDAVEFAGFRSVIRNKAVKNAMEAMQEIDTDGDGLVSNSEAVAMARRQDDMDSKETYNLFNVADQDKSGRLDKVELADFLRLVRLSAIKFATDHFREFDTNRDKTVTLDELEDVIEQKYKVDRSNTRQFFEKVDADDSGDLSPGEIVDFRHEIRRYVTERDAQHALEQMKLAAQGENEAGAGHTEEKTNGSDDGNDEKKLKEEVKAKHVKILPEKAKAATIGSNRTPPKRKQPQSEQKPIASPPSKGIKAKETHEVAEHVKDDSGAVTAAGNLNESEATARKDEENISEEITSGSSMQESTNVASEQPKTEVDTTADIRDEPAEMSGEAPANEQELEATTDALAEQIIADEPQEIVEESIIEGEANSEREKNPESKSNDETETEPEATGEDADLEGIITQSRTQATNKSKKQSKKHN